jgi:serine/threonine-protein kinase
VVTANKTALDRFHQEVRLSAKLHHANIVTAFDAGEYHGIHYLAMEYVEGECLDTMLSERGTLAESEVLAMAKSVAEALDYAWQECRLLHRDIKPANIMRSQSGEYRLLDMGVARLASEDTGLTIQGTLVGTPQYMSPEQAKSASDLDCRADIYSMGATLYHLLTGAPPFDAPSVMGILAKAISETPEAPDFRNVNVSRPCSDLVMAMLSRNPDDRPRDWQAVVENTNRVQRNEAPVVTASLTPQIVPEAMQMAMRMSFQKPIGTSPAIQQQPQAVAPAAAPITPPAPATPTPVAPPPDTNAAAKPAAPTQAAPAAPQEQEQGWQERYQRKKRRGTLFKSLFVVGCLLIIAIIVSQVL